MIENASLFFIDRFRLEDIHKDSSDKNVKDPPNIHLSFFIHNPRIRNKTLVFEEVACDAR